MSESSLAQKNAHRRLENFKREYAHLMPLACHAALPVVLNTELLHLIRINFFLDPPEPLSHLEESQLLFSPVCQEIGADLYEIGSELRNILLQKLKKDYGDKRAQEVAGLLWQYIDRRSPWEDRIRLERAQQLTALNFLNPEKSQKWLTEAEESPGFSESGMKDWFIAMYKEIERKEVLSPKIEIPSSDIYNTFISKLGTIAKTRNTLSHDRKNLSTSQMQKAKSLIEEFLPMIHKILSRLPIEPTGGGSVPRVSLAEPKAFPLEKAMQATGKAWAPPSNEKRYKLVRLAFTLHELRDSRTRHTEAILRVDLKPSSKVVAHDLYPQRISAESSKKSVNVELGADLKFSEAISISGPNPGVEIEFQKGNYPMMQAFGLGESNPYWVFKDSKRTPLIGSIFVYLVLEAPKELERVELEIELEAAMETRFGLGLFSSGLSADTGLRRYTIKL